MDKIYLNLSVHDVVDFLLRKGDIDNRVYNDETMAKGNILHASFQKSQGKDYLSEVPLEATFVRPKGTIHLQGRADGIILGGPHPVIDEIKSTVAPLESFYALQKEWHFGQAYCYAYMYGEQKGEKELGIRLTYLSQNDSSEKKIINETRSIEELEAIVHGYLDRYLDFYSNLSKHKQELKKTSKEVSFPFPHYRPGQREMAKYIYGVAKNGGTFFCEAPTGIGKTISALFPAIKSFANTDNEKIFYLTAKSTGRDSVFDTLSLLRKGGLSIKDSYLRAKDKMCPCLGKACNPDECPLTKNYFEKVRLIMEEEALKDSRYTIDYVTKLASDYEICPFELQLDLSLLSDVIVCDYNYFFDPFVKLDRYFGEDRNKPFPYLILVDEAHNLIERGRSMYSSSLSLSLVEGALKCLKEFKHKATKTSLNKIKKFLKGERKRCETEKNIRYDALPKEVKASLSSFLSHRDEMEEDKEFHPTEDYKNFSREAFRFSSLLEDYGEKSILYFSLEPEPAISLFSLDPSEYLRSSLEEAKGRVLFSATLSPISFYMNSIYEEEAPYLLLPCPFKKENMKVYFAPMVSTRYKDRDASLEEVASYLEAFVNAKVGNYFLFFPSFEYLSKIKDLLHFSNAAIYEQEKSMDEDKRAIFLSCFKENPSFSSVGLLVIGGAFSEGIDLVGSRLEGVAIIGVGLSQPSFEKEEIRHYFDEENGEGFAYAYRAPGINRIMQGLGRLIRSETDKGVALLIDDRYLKQEYRSVIGRRYPDYEVVTAPNELKEDLSSFYHKNH